MSGSFKRSVPRMTVRIAEHDVPPRFHVNEFEMVVHTADRKHAIRTATYAAAREAGIPPGWKPWLRAVASHAKIIRVDSEDVKIG